MALQEPLHYQASANKKKGRVKEIDARIGERLKEIRELKNLNQSDIADILDVSFQQFQKYEKGSNRISFTSLLILSHALKIPLSDFAVKVDDNVVGLSDSTQNTLTGYANDSGATIKENKEILRLFNTIEDSKTRKYLLKFIKGIVDTKEQPES